MIELYCVRKGEWKVSLVTQIAPSVVFYLLIKFKGHLTVKSIIIKND